MNSEKILNHEVELWKFQPVSKYRIISFFVSIFKRVPISLRIEISNYINSLELENRRLKAENAKIESHRGLLLMTIRNYISAYKLANLKNFIDQNAELDRVFRTVDRER